MCDITKAGFSTTNDGLASVRENDKTNNKFILSDRTDALSLGYVYEPTNVHAHAIYSAKVFIHDFNSSLSKSSPL